MRDKSRKGKKKAEEQATEKRPQDPSNVQFLDLRDGYFKIIH